MANLDATAIGRVTTVEIVVQQGGYRLGIG